ncbi:MAG: hypothetical protein JWR83_1122 [Aeromicrobium sp.]|nr:hypothetical protein [Aeromicrobium sp.]
MLSPGEFLNTGSRDMCGMLQMAAATPEASWLFEARRRVFCLYVGDGAELSLTRGCVRPGREGVHGPGLRTQNGGREFAIYVIDNDASPAGLRR